MGLPPQQYVLFALLLPPCLRREARPRMMKVLVEMMQEDLALSSRLMECSMPAYRSLTVTSQMSSSAAKDWLPETL